MAIENTYLLGKNITLGCGFDLQAKAPLDSRQVVPAFAGLQALIDGNAAFEGMIVYDEETKKTYQAQLVDGILTFREFGINEAELKNLIAAETTAAMEFKGATSILPTDVAKGDLYKASGNINVSAELDAEGIGFTTANGDSIVYDGEKWYLIPSANEIDTWRPVTDVDSTSTLTFEAGDNLEKTVAANGTITYKHSEIAAPTDETTAEDEKTRTYITQLITDNHGHIVGFKTATEDVVDTNTTYTFEGQSDEATSVYFQVTSSEENANAEVIYLDAYNKNEIAAIIGTAGTPEEKDTEGNVTKQAVPGTGIFEDIYSKDEIAALIQTVTGGQSAGEVQQELNEYKANNDAIVKGYDTEEGHVNGLVDNVAALLAVGAEANIIEALKLGTADNASLPVNDKSVVIPVATAETLGVVKSSEKENEVSVTTEGIMQVNSLNVNKLSQTTGEWLILNGGNADLNTTETN